jgi:hypothetical protein
MARGKKHTAEQIVNLLRQVEVGGVPCGEAATRHPALLADAAR